MITKLFNQAITNPRLRQEFLDSIDMGETRKYVRRVLYIPNPNKMIQFTQDLMLTKPSTLTKLLHLRGRRSTIKVFPLSFREIRDYNYFLSVLIDHEGFHARDFFYNPQLSSPSPLCFEGDIERSEMEVRAIQNQLRKYREGKRQTSFKLEPLRQTIEYHQCRIAGNLELMKEF